MPLTMLETGSSSTIKRVGGGDKVRQFLSGLGFNAGTDITVVSQSAGNVIVQVKESRVAISKEMAMRITV